MGAWWTLAGTGVLISVAAAAFQGSAELGLGLAIFFVLLLLPLRFPLETGVRHPGYRLVPGRMGGELRAHTASPSRAE